MARSRRLRGLEPFTFDSSGGAVIEHKTVVNINGELYSEGQLENAKVSIFDRGFLFGDSVYEVTCTYDGVVFKLEEHLDRLWYSASRLDLAIQSTRQELVFQLERTLKKLGETSAYIRLIITRGEGEIGLDPGLAHQNNLVIITRKLPDNPKWWYSKGVEMIIADVQRTPKEAIDPNVKSGNYLNNVLAYGQARKAGAFDAIMLNRDGQVTEGTTSNIWIVSQGVFKTPPLKAGLLEGITRKTLIELAKKNKLALEESNFGKEELLNAEECFLTSSTKRLVPITKINQQVIGTGRPGEKTLLLSDIYQKHIKDYVKKRPSVLNPV